MSAMRGQSELPDFPDLDESPTDKVDRMLARKRRAEEIEEARHMIRLTITEECVQKRMELLPKLLGPDPTTGEECIQRGMRGLELAMIEGSGFSPHAAKAYQEAQFKIAGFMEPKKYGNKVALTDADGGPLQVRVVDYSDSQKPVAPDKT